VSKLPAALAWAARGFAVFPLLPNSNKPAIDEFPTAATTDEAWLRAWWGAEPEYNIGCVPRDQIVVDLDVKKGHRGPEVYQALGLPLWSTMTVQTVSGGLHLYFVGPPTANSAGRIGEGIDTRGPSGYVVAPGSTIDGRDYQLIYDVPLATVPEVVLSKLRAPRERLAEQEPLIDLDLPSAVALAQHYLTNLPGATAGTQNNTLFALGAYLRDLGLSEITAAELIGEHWLDRCSPPIEYENMQGVIANAWMYAQNRPGSKHPLADFGKIEPPPELPGGDSVGVSWGGNESDVNPFDDFGNMIPLQNLQPRPWILHRFLLRREVTVMVATGGIGKSQLTLSVAVCLALGLPEFFGFKNHLCGLPQKSIIYNAEDSREEMSMRLHATCLLMRIDPALVSPYIVLVSGKDIRMKLLVGGHQPTMDEEAKQVLSHLMQAARKHKVAMIGLDPLNKLHEIMESDNNHMGRLMELMSKIATEADCGLLLAHHTAKPGNASSAGYAGSANSARGAIEIINGARAAFTLSNPTEDDILSIGLDADQRRYYLRLDDAKANRTLLGGEPVWIHKTSIDLPNGEQVGAFGEVNIKSVSAARRQELAEAFYAEMTSSGRSTLPLTLAATLYRRIDPLSEQMTAMQAKLTVERLFRAPVEISTGGRLSIGVDGKDKVVAIG
jgi:Bifunctional DNA primase/polymerase, N-terminal/AAA domain